MDNVVPPVPPKKKRNVKTLTSQTSNMTYTVDGVMTTWNDTTEYDMSFRKLTDDEQQAKVRRSNKGAEKQMKGIIKNKLIAVNYTTVVAEKLREHLSAGRVQQASMFHASPKTLSMSISNPNFISVGEWVEVDADRSPGFNSEGGIAVIISVHDNFADVKYVLTKWVEKLIPIRRLTTIPMPHRGPRASLRQTKVVSQLKAAPSPKNTGNNFRTMSHVQILKYGLTNNLWKKKGWLFQLLHNEGIVEDTRQSRKEHCWSYYKSQMLYIEAMQDAKQDADFDPRRSDHKTGGKDGKFVKAKHGTVKPKNPLTVTYLCFAFDIPYASFKRWKNDAFVSKTYVPEHKGKSVLTDKEWASKIYNARRMYISHTLAVWLEKNPTKKNDTNAKKVGHGYDILKY